jgi:CxxC motif-containing protein (DUF1111 family)
MLLAAPEPSESTVESQNGLALFRDVACHACHVETLESPRGLIPLYSDLLLHDMGEEMADGLQMGVASGAEFRTQPLWGISAVGPYLHDGRADTLHEAILAHAGEAQNSAEAYSQLSDIEQFDLIAFLEHLGGLEQRTDGLIPPNQGVPAEGQLGAPINELNTSDVGRWMEGRRLYDRDMHLADGLGPVFNGDSCRACHFEPRPGGAGPIGVNVMRHGTWVGDEFVGPAGGTILHKFTVPGVWRVEAGDGVNVYEPRQTPHTLGLGLIELIDEADVLAAEDPDDADGNGISGRAHIVVGDRLGRFGWKAQVPSIREFARDAMGAEVGLTVPVEQGQTYGATADDDDVPDPELSSLDLDALEFFIAELNYPLPVAQVTGGVELFESVGCSDCHTVSFETSAGTVPLYSDLLLHDVAPEGYVGIPDGEATSREFRTPPLWGISGTAPYMHDGAASTVEASIALHFSEGAASVVAFNALQAPEQALLLEFLESL